MPRRVASGTGCCDDPGAAAPGAGAGDRGLRGAGRVHRRGAGVFPVKSRAAILPDVLWVGAVLTAVQSYAAGESYAGVLRWYMAAAAFAGAGAAAFVLGVPLRAVGRAVRHAARWPGHFVRVRLLRPALDRHKENRQARKRRRNAKRTAKNPKKNLPNRQRMLYNSNVSK